MRILTVNDLNIPGYCTSFPNTSFPKRNLTLPAVSPFLAFRSLSDTTGGGAGASAGLRDTPWTRKGIGTWTRSIFHTPGPRLTGEAWTRSTIRHDAAQKKTPGQHSCCPEVRRTAATYSPTWCVSTIGADELNGSVRDGKRWILIALTTAICYLRDYTLGTRPFQFTPHGERSRAISTGRLCRRRLYTSRLSTS